MLCTHIAYTTLIYTCIKGILLYNFKHTEICILFCHTLSLSLSRHFLCLYFLNMVSKFFFFDKQKMGGLGGGGGATNKKILFGCDYSNTIPTGSRALLGYKKTTVSHNFKTYGSS